MKQHFVIFYSPGTFFAETTEKPIKSWDVGIAKRMARKIKERYGATPFGFQFTTRERTDKDLDSKIVKRSGTYFLGGKIETIQELEIRNDPKEEILRSNMRGNGLEQNRYQLQLMALDSAVSRRRCRAGLQAMTFLPPPVATELAAWLLIAALAWAVAWAWVA